MPQHPLALPPSLHPDTLDTLTEMATVLSRVRTSVQNASATGGLTGSTPAAAAATPGLNGSPSTSLALKDVPSAADALKHKLQRARSQVKALPDMARTIAEQEAEIRALEARIEKQREVLEQFRGSGITFVADEGADTKMDT